MNTRRKLVMALGVSAFAPTLQSFAQQSAKVWRVGILVLRKRPASIDSDIYGEFPRAMRELGYIEGKNLLIEWRFADDRLERLPAFVAEFVALKVDAIVTAGTPATSAVRNATTTIPIVMASAADPVGSGLVKSLARPGGNITGLSIMTAEIGPKRLEMLIAMVPKLARIAVLVYPSNPSTRGELKSLEEANKSIGLKLLPLEAETPEQIERAFATMIRENAQAVIVLLESFFTQQRQQIAELAMKHRLPSIGPHQMYVEAGVLMSYGVDFADNYRRAAGYVDKILKGAKPADLPVEQPTKFRLIINGKTAKALSLTIPQSLLISADKVIE